MGPLVLDRSPPETCTHHLQPEDSHPMHALRRFIQSELDNRGWQARDLVKASGPSKQLVSNLLNDDRDVMPQLPRTATLDALASAFGVTTAHVTTVAVEAL